jgi:hypothetical protein
VTVPDTWHRAVADGGWQPPIDDEDGDFAALSVGTRGDWNRPDVSAEGVFVGLLPGTELPTLMPQHPECDHAASPVGGSADEPATTVWHTGCPAGVTVERVVQVAGNRLLWVQVRSQDRGTAAKVLDSVDTHGL